MKTTIEVQGYEIKIDEMNDKIMISAEKDGEVVEQFELEIDPGFEDDNMGGMEPFGEEEDDFEGEMDDDDDMDDDDMDEMEEGDDDMEEDEEEEQGENKLESFSHFVKRRK
jgi:hypothetical protein